MGIFALPNQKVRRGNDRQTRGAATLIPTKGAGRKGARVGPYPSARRRMLGIKDVSILAREEGGALEIPGRMGIAIKKISLRRKQGRNGKNYEVGNVQIV